MVKPDTLVLWHRKGFRLFWRWKSRPKGRPTLPEELKKLIAEMAVANITWGEERIAHELVLSKNTNELKTGAPGRFDRHRPVASPRSGACRRRCRRFGFSARAGKTPSSNGIPRSRAETWIQARAAPGPERASPLRHGSPGLDSGPLGWPLFRRCTVCIINIRPLLKSRTYAPFTPRPTSASPA